MAAPQAPRLTRLQRRKQLLDAAQRVFVRAGYHAAAMDDIAAEAGISKPVLYQHFPGKLELYLALLDLGTGALEAVVRDALTSTTDNHQRVQATISAYFGVMTDPEGTFRLVFESDLTGEPAVRQRLDAVTHACTDVVASAIAADTQLDEEAALLLAAGLTGAAQVSARWWMTRNGSLDRTSAEELVSALAWRGISGFPRVDPDPVG